MSNNTVQHYNIKITIFQNVVIYGTNIELVNPKRNEELFRRAGCLTGTFIDARLRRSDGQYK